jgi:acetyl-CoA acyltransferase
MSNFPVLISKPFRNFLNKLSRARGWRQKLNVLFSFRFQFLKPEFPKIADPICGLSMGQTAENVARDFKVSRKEQDYFAFVSQERAAKARKDGRFAEEIVPIPVAPAYDKIQEIDDGPRDNQSIEDLKKLPAAFDKLTGTVTAGNSSQVTDGAVALLVMAESKAKKLGLKPIGYFSDYAFAGLDPSRMGLGPVFATSLLLNQTGLKLEDFDLIEINEAFAAQVLGCVKAFASDEFAQKFLNRDKAIGRVDMEKLNVNGGAIALGHPLGASGARLVLTMLLELKRRNKKRGLVALCIGGGQGEAALLEVE